MGRVSTMATTLALVASLVACDDTGRAENDAARNTTPAPTMAATPWGPTPKGSASGVIPSPDEPKPGQELTGFGATRQAWDANHEQRR